MGPNFPPQARVRVQADFASHKPSLRPLSPPSPATMSALEAQRTREALDMLVEEIANGDNEHVAPSIRSAIEVSVAAQFPMRGC